MATAQQYGMDTPTPPSELRKREHRVLVKDSESFWVAENITNGGKRSSVRNDAEHAVYQRIVNAVNLLYKRVCMGVPDPTQEPVQEAVLMAELFFERIQQELRRSTWGGVYDTSRSADPKGMSGAFDHEPDAQLRWLYEVAYNKPEALALVCLTLARLWGDEEGVKNIDHGMHLAADTFSVLYPTLRAEKRANRCIAEHALAEKHEAIRSTIHSEIAVRKFSIMGMIRPMSLATSATLRVLYATDTVNNDEEETRLKKDAVIERLLTRGHNSEALLLVIGQQLCEINDTMHDTSALPTPTPMTNLRMYKGVVRRMQHALATHLMKDCGRVTTEYMIFARRCDMWDAMYEENERHVSKKRRTGNEWRREHAFNVAAGGGSIWDGATRLVLTAHVFKYMKRQRESVGPHALSPVQLVDAAVNDYMRQQATGA